MPDPDRDTLLKDMAANRGCKLVKSRKRTPGTGDYGRYGLKDAASDREVFGFGAAGLLTATPDEIEAWLRKGALSDWKSSLAAAAAGAAPANDERTPVPRSTPRAKAKPPPAPPAPAPAPRAKPRLRVIEKAPVPIAPRPPPPPPRPSPPPPPRPILKIREARPADAVALAALLGRTSAKALAARLAAMRKAGTPPLVADEGGALRGVCAYHLMPLLHEGAPLGRLTLLLVAPDARRKGHGRALAEAAATRLAQLGCTHVEALAEIELAAAPDFFRRLGWSRNAYRYALELSGR